jgi:hypothetical protein
MQMNTATLQPAITRTAPIQRGSASEGDQKLISQLREALGGQMFEQVLAPMLSDGKIDDAERSYLNLLLDVAANAQSSEGSSGSESPQSSGTCPAPACAAAPAQQAPASEAAATGMSAGTSTGTAGAAGQAFDKLLLAAGSDGDISANERTALNAFAKAFGLNQGASADPTDQLRELLKSSMSDGSISAKEARQIAELAGKMDGESTLSGAELAQVLSEFMQAAQKDGNFGRADLRAFEALLSLAGEGNDESSASSPVAVDGSTGLDGGMPMQYLTGAQGIARLTQDTALTGRTERTDA